MLQNRFLIQLWSAGLALILLGYFWIDRPLSTFIYLHHWREHLAPLKNIIEWPPVISGLAPFIFLILILLRCRTAPRPTWQKMLLTLSLSVMVAYLLKNDFKWIFSRYWPETWINNNPSWISNQAYGFQWFEGSWFQGTDATGSFPSGHSTIAFASLTPIGLYYRHLLWPCLILAALEAFSMLAFDYHFFSDVIAGSCLGLSIAILLYRLLEQPARYEP